MESSLVNCFQNYNFNMKKIVDIVNEASGWNPDILRTHRDSYNSFIKWYDKQLKTMNKDELLDMLSFIFKEIKDDSLSPIK